MANSQRHFGTTMRPNIQVTHTLNGRVKDVAAAWGLNLDDAYRLVIEKGLEELEAGEVETDGSGKPMEFEDCPWCGEPVTDAENAFWHLQNCPD